MCVPSDEPPCELIRVVLRRHLVLQRAVVKTLQRCVCAPIPLAVRATFLVSHPLFVLRPRAYEAYSYSSTAFVHRARGQAALGITESEPKRVLCMRAVPLEAFYTHTTPAICHAARIPLPSVSMSRSSRSRCASASGRSGKETRMAGSRGIPPHVHSRGIP